MAKTSAPLTSDRFDFVGISDDLKASVSDMLADAAVVSFADDVASILDDSERILDYCRAAFDGMAGADKPAQRRTILAAAATARLAMVKFPNDPERRAQAWKIPANRPDGATVSGSAIGQRAEAYSDVVSLGITPSRESVKEAFRLTSTGGSKPYREARDKAVREDKVDFIAATKAAMDDLLKVNRQNKVAKAAKAQAAAQAAEAVKFDGDKGTFADVVFAIEWATANIAKATPAELTDLRKALAGLAPHFAPAK